MTKRIISIFIAAILLINPAWAVVAQNANTTKLVETQVYDKIQFLEPSGKEIKEMDVRVRFSVDSMEIESKETGKIIKKWTYSEIQSAEYSYTKNPRWKTGLGLGAASVVFPPLLLIAIPVGFTKHRRHWLTLRTNKDFAVLKLGKSIRKIFIPDFETRSSVKVAALGEDK